MAVAHHVLISIVGIDTLPFSYYQAKLQQERVVAEGSMAASMLRSTQFSSAARSGVPGVGSVGVPPGGALLLLPIDAREVACSLASAVEGLRPRRWGLAGPDVLELRELARLVAGCDGRGSAPAAGCARGGRRPGAACRGADYARRCC
jgi:hypothetical protein